MASNTERELGPGPMELKGDPRQDVPTGGRALVDVLAQRRERNEVATLAANLNPRPTAPGRIADEMRNRARFLRSKRGGRATKRLELEVLCELDAIEANARELDGQQRRGALGGPQLASELKALGEAAFAVRGRFEALMLRQDLPWRVQAAPPEPDARQRELDQIEAFLARKRQRRAA